MSEYQVLYRKWRPRRFAEVSGQPHVTAALQGEVSSGRLAHAYLFTGSRGTGKTTCAKILSKAVNCLHPVNGDPCNECEVCRGIDNGSITDVVEIDAAANNGVDNIRELREEVNFTPAVAKYRVYIIDEVHELTGSAFNALLKTLEEPPAHVVFVLATTEVHKLPATILSRCQRFDFARISPEEIAARLQFVAGEEGFTLTEDAALLIARLADGALRDALSLTDQCLSRSRDITAEVVAEATGMAGQGHLYSLSEAVRGQNAGAALALIDTLHNASKDMERLCAELIEFYRRLMILKSVEKPEEMIVTTAAELAHMKEEAACYSLPAVLHCLTALQTALDRLRGGVSRRVEMEMAMIKLCSPEMDAGVDSLLRRLEAVESTLRSGAALKASASPVPTTASASEPSAENDVPWDEEPAPAKASAVPPTPEAPAPEPSAKTIGSSAPAVMAGEEPLPNWAEVLEKLNVACPPLGGVLSGSSAVTEGQRLTILTDNDLFRELVKMDGNSKVLLNAVREVTGHNYRIGVRTATKKVTEQNDPLSAFLESSRQNGVQIEEK